jgi:hypothetical protein
MNACLVRDRAWRARLLQKQYVYFALRVEYRPSSKPGEATSYGAVHSFTRSAHSLLTPAFVSLP